MIDILHREAVYFWYYFSIQLEQIFGFWVAGMILGSVISVFFKDRIHKAVGKLGKKKTDAAGIAAASVFGILSPLCMYGTIPIAASFSKSGIKDDWLAAFMMSSILLNPQLLIYSAALGPTMLAVRIISCFVCGCTAGVLVRAFCIRRRAGFFNFSGFDEPRSRDIHPNMMIRFLKNPGRNVKATGIYFLMGIVLSALLQRYVPEDMMVMLFGGNNAFGVLMAATVGVPLYVCGGGTIPLLQAWLYDGMSAGSAAAFMVTGAATKITNLGAVKIVLGIKHFVVYFAYIMIFAFVTGIIVNVIIYR